MTYYAQISDGKVTEVVDTTNGFDPTANTPVGQEWVKCTKTTKEFDSYNSATKKFTKYVAPEIVDGKVVGEDYTLGEDVKIKGEGYKL